MYTMYQGMRNQHTLSDEISFSGVSVHMGNPVRLVIKPYEKSRGIVFKRVDVMGDNLIKATYDSVVETNMCTVIANSNGVKVKTIEHLMAALWGCGVDNALIEIDSDEVPIMDGSSDMFVKGIKNIGLIDQGVEKNAISITNPITVKSGDKMILLEPSDHFSISCEVEIDHESIGAQTFSFDSRVDNFEDVVAPARTYGFKRDLDRLQGMGFALGVSLENTVGIDEMGVMNEDGLRYNNEFARHKVLDCIGDFALSGCVLNAKVTAYKPSHGINNQAMRELFLSLGA